MKSKSPSRSRGQGFGNHLADDKKPSTTPAAQKPTRQARWQAQNPMARWAHIALRSALRRGLIERTGCEVWGADQVDGHHDDYDKPAAVGWLRHRHHIALHRERRK